MWRIGDYKKRFIQFLKDEGVWESYIEKHPDYRDILAGCREPTHLVDSCCAWFSMPEGRVRWNELDSKWKGLVMNIQEENIKRALAEEERVRVECVRGLFQDEGWTDTSWTIHPIRDDTSS